VVVVFIVALLYFSNNPSAVAAMAAIQTALRNAEPIAPDKRRRPAHPDQSKNYYFLIYRII